MPDQFVALYFGHMDTLKTEEHARKYLTRAEMWGDDIMDTAPKSVWMKC